MERHASFSSLTGQPDTPWSIARRGRPEDARDIEISNELMQSSFLDKAASNCSQGRF